MTPKQKQTKTLLIYPLETEVQEQRVQQGLGSKSSKADPSEQWEGTGGWVEGESEVGEEELSPR